MSYAGIYGELWSPQDKIDDVLLIGARVPRIHHADGIKVYLVVEHEQGSLLSLNNGESVRLLAYPSDWPGPGESTGRFVYARHERLPWHGPVLCFDKRPEP